MKGLLLSGGMDSIALAAWKRPELAFTIDYGQRAAATEVAVSRQVCAQLGIDHEVVCVDCSALGTGDMSSVAAADCAPASDWWPFRNQLLVTLAGMRCVVLGVSELMLGTVATDGIHADGTGPFFAALNQLLSMQEGALRVSAPALEFTSAELIRRSGVEAAVLAWAHSCHTGSIACGTCRGCVKHIEVTRELGVQPY